MKVIMLSRDVTVLEAGSPAYQRMLEYRALFDDLHIVLIRGNIFSFLRSFAIAGAYAKKMSKDDWITSQDPFEAGIVAFVVAKLFGLKLQLQLHTDCFNRYFIRHSMGNALRACLARLLIGSADSLRVVSEHVAASVKAKRLLEDDRIAVLPILVDTNAYRSKPMSSDLKAKYPEFAKIIIMSSRLSREKNIPLALSAFQKMLRLLKESGNAKRVGLVIAGMGKEEKWLREYAAHLGITEDVRFEGFVTDTVSLYKSADLLFSTSFYEGYGMAVVEALASGCPVISTDVGIARDAGAVIVNFDAGEIALRAVEVINTGRRGRLAEGFTMSKAEYLKKFKATFLL